MADRKASRISKKPPEKWWSLVLDQQTVVFDKSSVMVAVPWKRSTGFTEQQKVELLADPDQWPR
jgi:hypothetical protein